MNTEHCIKICNGLLRGERSAVETYTQALASLKGGPPEMARIREDHIDSVTILSANVLSMGGVPDLETGAWGVFAEAVQGTADAFGTKTAFASLETGEKSGRSDYEKALEDEGVMPECKEIIRSKLLPRIAEHIAALETLQKAA